MTNSAARRKARHYGMQALYQWQLTDESPAVILQQFQADYDMTHVDTGYFSELVNTIPSQVTALDEQISQHLSDRTLKELDPITLALLRMGVYELQHRLDVPYKVVISEAVSLGKKFGAAESFKFINALLEKLSKTLRTVEHRDNLVPGQ